MGPKSRSGPVRSGGVGLSQTSPIPRSPDGDNKYELKTNEQVIQQIQSQHCSNITLFVQQPKILQGMVESKILWFIRICGA